MAQDDIQGQVVDGAGNPVSGAIVELTKSYQSSPAGQEAVQRTTTDSNGNYIFTGHPDGDGTTQEWHVAAYSHDGTAYVNSFNNPGVTAELPSNAIPDGELDHRYAMDEGSGTTLNDAIGSQPLSINGASWVTGQGGRGDAYLDFNGSGDYATDDTSNIWDTDTWTWMGWINPDAINSGDQNIIRVGLEASSEFYVVAIGSFTGIPESELGLGINNGVGGSNISISTSVNTNEWQFWAATGDLSNTTASFYYASVNDETVSQVGTVNYENQSNAGEELLIGARQAGGVPGEFFDGQMDHPASNVTTALSQSTIQSYFDATKGDF